MANIFDISSGSITAFSRFYKKAPFKARQATARLLSQFAFGTREQAIIQIRKSMNVRDLRFVSRSIRFFGARASRIEDQESVTASMSGPRFSGWKEQEDGTPDKRTRSQSLLARGGSFGRKVKPSMRLKPSRSFITMADFKLPEGQAKVPAYIKIVKKGYKNKPFILNKKYKQIKRGVYKFTRGKMMILQNFEKKPRKVKTNPWMFMARRKYFFSTDIDKEWNKAFASLLKKKKF